VSSTVVAESQCTVTVVRATAPVETADAAPKSATEESRFQ